MTAARLPFNNSCGIIAKDEVELSVKRHGDRHIGEECSYTWHLTPSKKESSYMVN